AVLGSGDERADVESKHSLALERLRNVPLDDPVREALGDRGLSYARLADERGVVLGAPAQDLDDPLDLLLATDDRIELARLRHRGEIHAELVERRRLGARRLPAGRRGLGRLGVLLAERRDDLVPDLLEGDSERLQNPGGDPLALADEAEKKVLRSDVIVVETDCLILGKREDSLGAVVKAVERSHLSRLLRVYRLWRHLVPIIWTHRRLTPFRTRHFLRLDVSRAT